MKKIFIFLAAVFAATAMQAEVIFNGEPHDVGTWSALRLIPSEYSKLSEIVAGDVLVITMTTDATDACVKLQDGDWNEFEGEEYVRYDVPSGAYAFALGEVAASAIASKGVCVTGKNYTSSKVELYYHKAKIWDVSVSDNTGWKQSEETGHNPSIFASLAAGDLLGAEITAINDGAEWHQYTIRGREDDDASWSHLEDIIFATGINKKGIFVTKLSAEQVTSLQTKNINVAVQYLDLNGLHTYQVTKGSATAIENTSVQNVGVKVLRDGILYIQRGETLYNMQGQIVK